VEAAAAAAAAGAAAAAAAAAVASASAAAAGQRLLPDGACTFDWMSTFESKFRLYSSSIRCIQVMLNIFDCIQRKFFVFKLSKLCLTGLRL
jgi:hypothetical protein